MNNLKLKLLVLILFSSSSLFADYIFLKDGNIITGKILHETKDNVIIRDIEKKEQKISHNYILRTVYREYFLGKQLIQLTSGRRFEAYLVDEDRKQYIFRYDLYKPEEFTVERDKVLFISRNNPTDLIGYPRQNSIKLEWKSPYKPSQKYNIYLKSADDKDFIKIGESYNTTYEAKGLLTKSVYSFIVKGVDSNKESIPTNEISLKTTIPPEKLSGITLTENLSKDKKELTVKLKWKMPIDEDGKVVKFNIYEIHSDGLKKIGETDKTEFIVDKLNPVNDNRFIISAVDDDGAESELPNPIQNKYYEIRLPSGIRLSYMLAMPLASPINNYYTLLHGGEISYLHFFNDFISIKVGGSFTINTYTNPNIYFFLNSYYFGINFGISVIGFIYPYIGLSVKGIWVHEQGYTASNDFGGFGIDGSTGIAFTIAKFFGVYAEYTIGWAMAFDKAKTDLSSHSVKGGVYFRF